MTQTLDRLALALACSFGVRTPRVLLQHVSTQPVTDDGRPVWGGYFPGREEIHLWDHSPRLLAHELGHHLWAQFGNAWPIKAKQLAELHPEACEAAMADLSKVSGSYPKAALEEELWARIFERIYPQYTQ